MFIRERIAGTGRGTVGDSRTPTGRARDRALLAQFPVIRNVSANWIGLLTVMLVGFFLTPYILHRLGAVAFGLWVLMTTVTGYYGLLDFGIRNAVVRYAARFRLGEQTEVAEIVSTACFTYGIVGVAVLALTFVGAWRLEELIRVPAAWTESARMLLLVVGVGTAFSFPLSVFAGVLEGLQYFNWVAGVQCIGALLRAGLIVAALEGGHGLLAVGVITVAINAACSLVYLFVARAVCPHIRLRWQYVQRRTLGVLAGFGLITFWIGIAQKLRFEADTLVIGAFLSVEGIALFAIGGKLVGYATEIVQNLAQVFTPMFSYLDATGDRAQLRHALVMGNRYSSFIAFTLAAVLVTMGKRLIEAWVGPAYLSSYAILVTLMVPTALYLSQAASTKVLYGMARHRTLAWALLAEGVANLVLSILLLRRYGVYGVALGTAIPLAVNSVGFLPIHTCRTVGLRLSEYLREAHLYPFLVAAAVAACLWAAGQVVHSPTYAGVTLQLAIGALFCMLGILGSRYATTRLTRLRAPDEAEVIQPTT